MEGRVKSGKGGGGRRDEGGEVKCEGEEVEEEMEVAREK